MPTGLSIFDDFEFDDFEFDDQGDRRGSQVSNEVKHARAERSKAIEKAISNTGLRGGGKNKFKDSGRTKGLVNVMKNDFKTIGATRKISSSAIAKVMNGFKGGSKVNPNGGQIRTWLNGQRNIPDKHMGTFSRAYSQIMKEQKLL